MSTRDTAAKVAGKGEEDGSRKVCELRSEEAFASSGKSDGGDELKCFKRKEG